MSYNPLDILPKFIWRHIITYLTYTDIVILIAVNSQFRKLDSDDEKYTFLNKCAIAVVKCRSKHMNFFWKYAIETYTKCISIDNLFQHLRHDIVKNTSDVFFYYKVFVKPGNYNYLGKKYFGAGNYTFNTNPCSIEINGSKLGSTTIKQISFIIQSAEIIISKYFSIKYIRFCNMPFFFRKFRYNNNSHNDKEFVIVGSYSELYVSNCIFEGHHSNLGLSCINKSTIINCQFIDRGINTSNYIFDDVIERMEENGFSTDIEYNITHCTFSLLPIINNAVNISKLTCKINFNDNTVLKARTLIRSLMRKTTFLIKNNNISNVDTCMVSCDDIIFEGNHFDNVALLYDTCDNVVVDNTNTFVNCGEQLIAQLNVNRKR